MNYNNNDQCIKMEIEDDQFIQNIDNNELYQIKNDLNLIKQYLNINTNKKFIPIFNVLIAFNIILQELDINA